MPKKLKTYLLLGLCLAMTSCDDSCEYAYLSMLDSHRTVFAGTTGGLYSFNPSPSLLRGSAGGQFTELLEIPQFFNPALRPNLPAGFQPGLIGLSQWGVTRWGPGGSNPMDFPMSSTPFNGVVDFGHYVLYTSHPSEGEIQKFDLATNSVAKFIQLGSGVQPMFMTGPPDCDYIGILDLKALVVLMFSPRTDSVTHTIPVSGSPSGLRITPDAHQLWVLDTAHSSISTWEPRTGSPIGKITMVPSPNALLFSPDGNNAFITSNAAPYGLYSVNTETYQIGNMLTLDEKPLGIAQDLYGSTLWIQNASGTVTAIDPIRYSIIGKTPAAPGTPLSIFSSSLQF